MIMVSKIPKGQRVGAIFIYLVQKRKILKEGEKTTLFDRHV